MKVISHSYGHTPEGKKVTLYTLYSRTGMTARLTDFGAILISLTAPDRHGRFEDITLGYEPLDGWIADKSYLGATVGRYGNRIAGGRFTLDGKTYQLATNDGPNHLHGGIKGYNKIVWQAEPFENDHAVGVRFKYTSPDGEEGYPGTLKNEVIYTLTDRNELKIEFLATTDKPTLCNPVHHTYWNLTGDPRQTILNHILTINADRYLPVGKLPIPTGTLCPVRGTPFDFTIPTPIGDRINQAGGYDHNWVLRNQSGTLDLAAKVYEPHSGRMMSLYTNQTGMQFYSGLFLDGSITGKKNIKYKKYTGLCLETQAWPDSPNQPHFPSCVLRPGETYHHVMVHKFSTK